MKDKSGEFPLRLVLHKGDEGQIRRVPVRLVLQKLDERQIRRFLIEISPS
jgi:hypothetical protein